MASKYGYLKVVKFLIDKSANIMIDNNYAIKQVSAKDHLRVVKFLIQKSIKQSKTIISYKIKLRTYMEH